MSRKNIIWIALLILSNIAVGVGAYRYGRSLDIEEANFLSSHTQATLAFAHYKGYGAIESLLKRKCLEAALTESRESKNYQIKLMASNIKRTNNDPELIEYIRLREPKLLEDILSGQIPEINPYTTTCPNP